MRIRPREVQAEGADIVGLPMLGVAAMLAVLFLAASPAWAQEATNTPGGEETAEVPRDRYDEEPKERTVTQVTKTETPTSESSIPSSPEAKSGSEAAAEPVAEPAAEPIATPKAEPLPELPARQTLKGQTPVLPKTGGADLLPLFLGVSCLVVGALALLLGRGGSRPGNRPLDGPPEGR